MLRILIAAGVHYDHTEHVEVLVTASSQLDTNDAVSQLGNIQ